MYLFVYFKVYCLQNDFEYVNMAAYKVAHCFQRLTFSTQKIQVSS